MSACFFANKEFSLMAKPPAYRQAGLRAASRTKNQPLFWVGFLLVWKHKNNLS